MKIGLQDAVDGVRLMAQLGKLEKPMADRLCNALDLAVLFSFTTNTIPREHVEFAFDPGARGLFRLPFPVIATAREHDGENGRWGEMTVMMRDADGGPVSLIEFNEMNVDGMTTVLPMLATWDAEAAFYGGSETLVRYNLGKLTLFVTEEKPAKEEVGNWLGGSYGRVVMLMSKGVSTQIIKPSKKLNRARMKRGKPPLRERYLVEIDLDKSRLIENEDGTVEDITGYVRGSPRMHWRRGHFRTLNRGTGDERVVPVAPALVDANELAGEVRRPKDYVVR